MSTAIPQATAGPSPVAIRPQSGTHSTPAPVARPTPAPPPGDRVHTSNDLDVVLVAAGVVALAIPVVGEVELGGIVAAAGTRALASAGPALARGAGSIAAGVSARAIGNAPAIVRGASMVGDWLAKGGSIDRIHQNVDGAIRGAKSLLGQR